jgi:cellobiose phosphorylase
VAAVNEYAWNGAWYRRATRDDGSWIGAAENRFGRIFLNPQTWAILADAAPPERAARCLAAVEEHLVTDAGALLLAPAWEEPDETVGYITRYAPGLRENGGVYTHAAVWAIAAAAKLGHAALVGRLLAAIDPATKDPERYWAEPYVLPGNVDGPASPHHGRAGWTWYTGSAAWLPRVVSEWVLGVRPTWDGLLLAPCLPPGWNRARMHRPWRGASLDIAIERDAGMAPGEVAVELDGRPVAGNLLPPLPGGGEVRVLVRCGL